MLSINKSREVTLRNSPECREQCGGPAQRALHGSPESRALRSLKVEHCAVVLKVEHCAVVLKVEHCAVVLKVEHYAIVLRVTHCAIVLNVKHCAIVLKVNNPAVEHCPEAICHRTSTHFHPCWKAYKASWREVKPLNTASFSPATLALQSIHLWKTPIQRPRRTV